jgi:acyl-CoA dehydrogenase
MRFTHTDDERHAREALGGFLRDTVPEKRYEQICAEPGGTDAALWDEVVGSGWLDMVSMSEDEGAEMSAWPISGVLLAEEFGRTLVPLPVELIAGFLLPLLQEVDAPWAKSTAELADGLLAVSVAPLMELLDNSRGSNLQVRSGADGGVTLNGALSAVQFAASSATVFVPIRLPDASWALARVALDQTAVSTICTPTVDPGRTCATVVLADAPVRPEDVIRTSSDGLPIEAALRRALISYLLVLDGKAIGGAQAMLERTVRYVEERTQFGVPIGSFQAIKHRIADMATAIETARALAGYTAWQVSRAESACDRQVLASRLYCAEMFRSVCESTIQCHGGMGFTWEQRLHYWYKSALFDAAADGAELTTLGRLLAANA